jgi:DNA integrity scanning protein DisA with diadenylate cyclase activity
MTASPAEPANGKSKSQAIKRQNKVLIKSAFEITAKTKSKCLFIYVDAVEVGLLPTAFPKDIDVLLVTKSRNYAFPGNQPIKEVITVPKLKLGRMGLIKISVLLALSAKHVQPEESVVFLTGKAEQSALDTVLCFRIGDESELLTGRSIAQIPDTIEPSVFEQTLNLAIELSSTGKEGKPVGTIFVLGDEEKVMQLSKQMIINPFKGYDPEERNLLNPSLKETIREFSSLDGSFVISGTGEVIAAGRYLGAAMEGSEIQRGLGSRHMAAAGITALTNAVAIVISESTGDIRIFRNGSVIMEIERPTR